MDYHTLPLEKAKRQTKVYVIAVV